MNVGFLYQVLVSFGIGTSITMLSMVAMGVISTLMTFLQLSANSNFRKTLKAR